MAEPDFEAPLALLQKQIAELRAFPGDPAKEREARKLEAELEEKRREVFQGLTPWQKTLVARNPHRPYTLDYTQALFTEFTELNDDRRYGDDPALVCCFAFYKDRPVAVLGHQKGRDTKQKIHRNFGMPKPEGYRKALRVMRRQSWLAQFGNIQYVTLNRIRKALVTIYLTPGHGRQKRYSASCSKTPASPPAPQPQRHHHHAPGLLRPGDRAHRQRPCLVPVAQHP